MYYIKAAATISHQPSFRNKGFSQNLILPDAAKLIHPDYKEFINPAIMRRMSEILRMSIACSVDCINQSNIQQPDAIIVGTGLGCLYDTEKFLTHSILIKEGMIPPTSFIQSTHNTIAGQISLVTGNHNYNMTHTQNTLSFELAMQDAVLMLNESGGNILVGSADERIDALHPIAEKLGLGNLQLTSGASFFILSKTKNENTKTAITKVASIGGCVSLNQSVNDFLFQNNIEKNTVDLILYSSLMQNEGSSLQDAFKETPIFDYQKYCGIYSANSSFAVHLASDIIEFGKFDSKENVKRILICNNLNPVNLGLIIVETVEA